MYCSKCGKQLPEGTTVCPDCSPVEVAPVESKENKKYGLKTPGKLSKSYAALFTAFLVFPASICIAIDLSFHKFDYWFGYVVGALIVTWVLAVLPFLRITPPFVTAMICFGAIMCYTFFIIGKIGAIDWVTKVGLPLFILGAAFISIDFALIGGKKINGLHILSVILAECAAYLVALELTFDAMSWGKEGLRWSLIISCGLVSAIAVLEAFNYIGKINKK